MGPEHYAGRPAMNKSVILCLAVYLRVSYPECESHGRAGSFSTDCGSIILKVRLRR